MEELDERLNFIEDRHDDLERYNLKFTLVIDGIPELGEEDIKRSECCYTRKTSASEFNTRRHGHCASNEHEKQRQASTNHRQI